MFIFLVFVYFLSKEDNNLHVVGKLQCFKSFSAELKRKSWTLDQFFNTGSYNSSLHAFWTEPTEEQMTPYCRL